jgi:branched-chain amino acid aminotransferase group I
MMVTYRPDELVDPRNAEIQVWVGDRLWPRDEARVSVFDSSVQGGDAVWEGLRVYDGKVFRLADHLARLLGSARALRFEPLPDLGEVRRALFATLEANDMRDGAHVRLTLTRGPKLTSGMSPRFNRKGTCLIVLAEWKLPVYDRSGIRLITSAIRRNSPQCLDSRIHHNNLLNNILAKLEADAAGVDDAVMLDLQGFVAETNATNIFLVSNGELATPIADGCLPGITRKVVLEIARAAEIPTRERRLTLAELWSADEAFTTGTMGELSPVLEIDGRRIGDGGCGQMTGRLQGLFSKRTASEGEPLPFC